jgi:hypothetical protein
MNGPARWLRLAAASPPMPVAVVMVAMMMPAVPPMVVMVPPVNFRRRQPGIFLNGCGGAGIAERHGIRRRSEREQRANGREPEKLRELHEISPLCVTPAPNGSSRRCTQSGVRDLNAS